VIKDEKLLDKKTVMERYHLKKWSLDWLIRTRRIPGIVRIGRGRGRFYFKPNELDAWIERNTINIERQKEVKK
jgi:predicted DNA-binding transcriptional regulator AlpA